MFQIKICGITSVEDARMAALARADAVGLNFYPKSPRCISPSGTQAIVESLPTGVVKVGLFVNAEIAQIEELYASLGLDLVQLHGDEPPEMIAKLSPRPVMRAFRLGPEGLAPVLSYLDECRKLGCLPRLVLLDAYVAGSYGGTGATADWATVATYPSESWHPPLVLAGGLTAENVVAAIQAVRPVAVDTASGVERSPGVKDAQLVDRFVAAAREAFKK